MGGHNGIRTINHTNIDIQAMLVWLIVPFMIFCGFLSVAVNSVYKLPFFMVALWNRADHYIFL